MNPFQSGPGSEVRDLSSPRRSKLSLLLKLLLVLSVIVVLQLEGSNLLDRFDEHFREFANRWGTSFIVLAFVLYVVLLSIPFVPGMEIGWTLMMIFGVKGVIMVYVASVVALSLSYMMGSMIPVRAIVRLLHWLHLYKASAYVLRMAPLSANEKLNLMLQNAPLKAIPFLLKHRYLAIAVAFNLPGNALIGGGGGIGLLSGLCGLFPFPRYLATVCLAVSPIPLILLANSGIPLLFG